MRRWKIWIATGLVGVCLAIVGNLSWRTFRRSQVAALRSCLLSSVNVLAKRPEMLSTSRVVNDEWQELDGNSRRELFSALEASGRMDCKSITHGAGQAFVDPWGTVLFVHARKHLQSTKVRFISLGPDHRIGTSDDVIVESP